MVWSHSVCCVSLGARAHANHIHDSCVLRAPNMRARSKKYLCVRRAAPRLQRQLYMYIAHKQHKYIHTTETYDHPLPPALFRFTHIIVSRSASSHENHAMNKTFPLCARCPFFRYMRPPPIFLYVACMCVCVCHLAPVATFCLCVCVCSYSGALMDGASATIVGRPGNNIKCMLFILKNFPPRARDAGCFYESTSAQRRSRGILDI